jgi:hypothetical protein
MVTQGRQSISQATRRRGKLKVEGGEKPGKEANSFSASD